MLKPRMAALSLGSVALFIALALAAGGGFSAGGFDAPMTALVVITLSLLVAALFTRASLSGGVREDRANRWVIVALGLLGLALAVAPPYGFAHGWLRLGGDGLRWIGVALYGLGGVLRLAPVFVLGNRFSGLVAIQPDHKLVTTGLYGTIRHPSYLGLLVLCFGWALAFASVVGALIIALMLIPLVARMNAEEGLLTQVFGAEYTAYKARTSRLIPGVY